MEKSKITYHIEPIRSQYLIEVRYNDGFTMPDYIGGYFNTWKGANKYLQSHKKIMNEES